MATAQPRKVSPFFLLSQALERAASGNTALVTLYFRLFYKKKIRRELDMASLPVGASILHIGCGPCPYTAMVLAEQGYQVTALDCVESAVEQASKLIQHSGLSKSVKIIHRDGVRIDASEFDAIWVSLNVQPKRQVLEQAFNTLIPGGVLIYRNVPCWLNSFYERVEPGFWYEGGTDTRLSALGAESVMVKKLTSA